MRVHVLIVDDSVIARHALMRALPPPPTWDIVVYEATNGVEAMNICRSLTVDVVFLDLLMPEMDGYQVLEMLRDEGLNCPVIVVSADIQSEAQKKAKQLGAIGFIAKPFKADEILRALNQSGIFGV
jgi:two-component system, chemotaxis family, chemotaxis protein CheY